MEEQTNNTASTINEEQVVKPGPTQGQIFGKSELLNAGVILRDILQISTGHVVGDLGAGGGLFTTRAAMLVGEQGQVYAVDIMKNVLGEIESQAQMAGLTNIKTIWSNLEMVGVTKIKEASLDFAMLVNVLFQSKKHYEMIAEATRLLKPNGKLLVVDWSNTNPGFAPAKELQVDPQRIIQHAKELNLTLARDFKAGNYHFGLIFVKSV